MKFNLDFFDNLNEIVYACNIENQEIVYVNNKLLEALQIKSADEIKGKKCYEVFLGCKHQCYNCNNKKLKEGIFLEYETYNPIAKKFYSVKDTLITNSENKKIKVEIAFDITDKEILSNNINNIALTELTLLGGIKLSLAEKNPDASINKMIEYIGQQLNSDRCYVFECFNKNMKRVWDNTYEWCSQGVKPEINRLKNIDSSISAIWDNKFFKGENIIITDILNIKYSDYQMYKLLLSQNIKSLVACPIFSNNKLIAFFGIDNCPIELLNNASTIFSLTSYFFAFLINRRNQVKKLVKLSYFDQLTGLKNRHALQDTLSKYKKEKNIGIIYSDVMGLKQINDTQGHNNGDELLIKVSQCLIKCLPNFDLFRLGGDEFLAITHNISNKELDNRISDLKESLIKNNCNMAIGYIWEYDIRDNFTDILSEVDKKMYEDKEKYYK